MNVEQSRYRCDECGKDHVRCADCGIDLGLASRGLSYCIDCGARRFIPGYAENEAFQNLLARKRRMEEAN